MSRTHEELLTASAEGNIDKVRDILESEEDAPLGKMAAAATENNHADILELCIDKGADVSDLNLDDLDFPEVIKILITKGGHDINEDWEMAGDLLINAVWELKVTLRLFSLRRIRLTVDVIVRLHDMVA